MSSAALASNMGSLACGGWLPWAGELFNHAGWFWMRTMMWASESAAHLPGAFLYVPSPVLADFAIYYVILFGVLSGWLLASRNRKWLAVAVVLAGGFYFWRWHDARSAATITAIPLNGGSAVFCDLPGRKQDVLVDCGETNSVQFVLKPFLRAQGVNSLSRLVLTHGDLRNVGGTMSLCEAMNVKSVLTSDARFRSSAYRRIVEELRKDGDRVQSVNRGETIGHWTVLHPAKEDDFARADDGALVLRGDFDGTRVLLLSDLGRPGQNALMEREKDLRADIVIAGLPEQGEPLCDALLAAVRPKFIVITDSEFPATKRAGVRLRQRLEERGVMVVYTRRAGAATFELRQGIWTARTAEGEMFDSRALPDFPIRTTSAAPDEAINDER
jgi:competence protein ComEC